MVLTHGAGMNHTMFDPQAAELQKAGYRVIRWDMPGHGASPLDPGTRFTATGALTELAALLDWLRLDRPVLIGHSLGGNLSQALVRADADRAGGLIVLDATWNAGPLNGLERLGLRLAAPGLAMIPPARLPDLMARVSAVTPEAVDHARTAFAAMPSRTFRDVWRATASLVAPEPGYRTPVPVALIRGARDRTGNIATAMPRWASAEKIDEHVIPAAGHLVTLDAPGPTSEALLDVLSRW
ncbi:3-oxoadipate enol-lactonase [Actinoplanes couchii]|uniref:3-oxoadipate enol-lactonase n=1 Tax=Actinoplanes couchii TaxID=403638 RepID=A0ABQ3XDL5_9ACTN|nr:3-oxoadipate enol-lactonase [Actinoplanes couchii]